MPGGAFDALVRQRFGAGGVPMLGTFDKLVFCIHAYVVWPEIDRGKQLYTSVKRHRWSFRGRLAYALGPP